MKLDWKICLRCISKVAYEGLKSWTWQEDDIKMARANKCPLQWTDEELPEKCCFALEHLMETQKC